MRFFENKKAAKAIKCTASVIWWVILVLLFILLVNIFGAKLTGKVPSVFGYSVMNIVSGSMEDEIPKDSYILIKKVSPEEIKKDDIICFYSSDPKIYGMPNTHRVVQDPIVTENGIEFVTKGDANRVNDTETAKGEKRRVSKYLKVYVNYIWKKNERGSGKNHTYKEHRVRRCFDALFCKKALE